MTTPSACERFRVLVSDLTAGVDLPQAEGPYRQHVAACEDCESWAQSILWQDRVLAELAGAARIDALLERIRRAITDTAPAALVSDAPSPLRLRRSPPAWPGRVASAAAVALVALGLWLLLRKPEPAPLVVAPPVERTSEAVLAKDVSPLPPQAEIRNPSVNDEAPEPPPFVPPVIPKEAVVKEPPKEAVSPVDAAVVAKTPDKTPAGRAVKDQVGPALPPPIDLVPRTSEQAVRLAVTYLRGKCEGLDNLKVHHDLRSRELLLWTMLHGGVPEQDPDFQRLLKPMLEARLEKTYEVALQAMLLEELDRVSYQWRILQCAQFLVDNQGRSGLWGYGAPSIFVENHPTPSGAKVAGFVRRTPAEIDAATGKPKVKLRVKLEKKREGADGGDHSNSMYAALGLRACHDAGVALPMTVVDLAQKAWREHQVKGEGGWCYGRHEGHKPYGSMTSGGVGSLVIYDYIQGRDWRKDRDVQEGLAWLSKNFSVAWNPGLYEHAKAENSGHQLYYYLYALERAAILYGTEQIGKRDWYAEGSKALVGAQRADGTWASKEGGNEVWDTCFAVLFLRKATRALPDVPTGPRK